jgi:hypothetical protein
LEARGGIEPPIKALQAFALPKNFREESINSLSPTVKLGITFFYFIQFAFLAEVQE